MNLKKVSPLAALVILAGCTNTIQYGGNLTGVRAGEEQYNLRVRMDSQIRSQLIGSDVRNEVYLYVNDILAVRGPLHRDQSGQLQGVYESKIVLLDCLNPGILSRTQCTVHIDGRDVGTLSLNAGANR
jgi:hypothetical protein